jgi:hypothetical protein
VLAGLTEKKIIGRIFQSYAKLVKRNNVSVSDPRSSGTSGAKDSAAESYRLNSSNEIIGSESIESISTTNTSTTTAAAAAAATTTTTATAAAVTARSTAV